jgi:biopolymer transport protein ExbD
MKFRTHTLRPAELQLAPMLDVVFQLLIFFIVSFEFQRAEMDMKVSVPRAKEGADSSRVQGEILINVRAKGEIVVERQVLSQQQLKEKLGNIAKLYPNQPVRLRGDATCTYQSIADVVNTCNSAGIWNITFAIEKAD